MDVDPSRSGLAEASAKIAPGRLAMVAPLVALLVFFLLTSFCVLGARDLYSGIVERWGVPPFPFDVTFGDMHGLLAAWQCHRLGIDVVEVDPCDILHRSFNYSPLWLLASPLRLDVGSTNAAGWVCGLLFVLGLFLLPPPRRARDVPIVVLATLSTMVAFAVERGNPDIIIFMLVLLAGYLALRPSWTRYLAYVVALAAGLLKYYPLTLLALTFRERVSTFLAVNLAALCLILIFAAVYRSELERGIPLIAIGIYYGDMFAAQNLPFGIAQTAFATGDLASSLSARSVAFVLYALMLLACATNSARMIRPLDMRLALSKLTAHESMFLALGSILIIGCFLAGQNVGYRGIFLLLVLPGLLAVSRNATDGSTRALANFTSVLIVLLMWGEFLRVNLLFVLRTFEVGEGVVLVAWFAFWLVRELAWWWSISVLAAATFYLMSQSEVGRWVSSALARRTSVAPPG
jgi:hypothetical protein